jgi:hypothetical protein
MAGGRSQVLGISRLPASLKDPVFKDSAASYFIQLVDFCAYALLRMERPIPTRTSLGYDRMYQLLRPIAFKGANARDTRGLGIIR